MIEVYNLDPGESFKNNIVFPDQFRKDFLDFVEKVLILISVGYTGGYNEYGPRGSNRMAEYRGKDEWVYGWVKPGTYLKALTCISPDDPDWCFFNKDWKKRKVFNITRLYNYYKDLDNWFLKIINQFRDHHSLILNLIDQFLPINNELLNDSFDKKCK